MKHCMEITSPIPTSLPENLPKVDPASWEEFQKQFRDFFQAHWNNVPQNLDELLASLRDMHVGHGILLAVAGLFYLFVGWKLFKPLVMLNAAVVGAVLGASATVQLGFGEYWWVGALAGGCVLGLVAWPMMKLFVALFGGALGAALGFSAFESIVATIGRGDLLPYAWAGAAVGGVFLALLAVLLFQGAVMFATSLQGSGMFACGVLCLLLKSSRLNEPLTNALQTHPPALLMIVVGLSAAGLVVQILAAGRHRKRVVQVKSAA
ncbi:MAG: DUF4203 domain-containing protein [Phycisphaerae bacterium]|nr:DUF4203 domain-containing protein [Phycisphaerae bacterium]